MPWHSGEAWPRRTLSSARSKQSGIGTGRERVTEYRHAIALNPSYPTARHWYSLHLARLGKLDDAELEIQRARALDPLSIVIATDVAETAYWARKPREAMARVDQVLALDPYFAEAHQVKGKIYEQEGQYEQALAELKIALALSGGLVHIEAMQGHTLALAGASDQALEIAKQLEDRSASSEISGVNIAAIYCGLGQTDACHALARQGLPEPRQGQWRCWA